MSKLTIIIPVYNEEWTLRDLLRKVERVDFPIATELIIIDDASTDRTPEILGEFADRHMILRHEQNRGKGAAIRTGLGRATGEWVVIQDADLEYDPNDLARMLEEMRAKDLTVLYGSREAGANRNRPSGPAFYLGGLFLTRLANVLYGQKITDEPTCYKMFKTEFIKGLPLVCERFEFCPEVTALTAKRGVKIAEIPISYNPRHKDEGKKIRFKDGVEAAWVLLKYRFK